MIKTVLGNLPRIDTRKGFRIPSSIGIAEKVSPDWFYLQAFWHGKDVQTNRLKPIVGNVNAEARFFFDLILGLENRVSTAFKGSLSELTLRKAASDVVISSSSSALAGFLRDLMEG